MQLNDTCRYIVRKEYFGGVAYDREAYKYYMCDETTMYLLDKCQTVTDLKALPQKYRQLAQELEDKRFYLCNGERSFRFVSTVSEEGLLSAPLQVYYDFTTKCFLRCRHCYNEPQSHGDLELKLSQIKRLATMLKESHVFKISLGGGEPLYDPRWHSILKSFRDNNLDVSLSTNGLLLGDVEVIKRLNSLELRTISISCDGGTQEEYDYIRGKGSFEALCNAMEVFKRHYKRRYALRVTLTTSTVNSIERIIDLGERWGCTSVKFKYLQQQGRAVKYNDLVPTKLDYNNAIDKALIYGASKVLKVAVPRHYSRLMHQKNTVNDYDFISTSGECPIKWGFGCSGGKIGIYITPSGYYTPCLSFGRNFWSGNVRTDHILDAWRNGKGFRSVRNLSALGVCTECEYLDYCKGGCRIRALAVYGSLRYPDPFCPLVPDFGKNTQK
jgi:radical SAM protein with 4Fe4S-binding SPASM domain